MWPFRRFPSPFAATYIVGGLFRESIQKRKAEKYAQQVVRTADDPYYDPFRTGMTKAERDEAARLKQEGLAALEQASRRLDKMIKERDKEKESSEV